MNNLRLRSIQCRLHGVLSALMILSMLLGALGMPTVVAQAAPAGKALQFNGTSQYVTFGQSAGMDTGLGVQVFTIETWFKKTGSGTTTTTGTGGLTAVPLVTKGRGEGDNSNVDMNYFFGIDSTGVLAADFEECARAQTGCPATASNTSQGGQNYPAKGSTVIQNNVWYHAAVTYDGRYWTFYLNGVQDGATTDTGASRYPRWDSIQHAGIGTAMTSTGAAAGYFAGVIDEVRVWNVVRTQAEIQASMNSELTNGTGLIGRWGLNEGFGTAAANSIAGRPNGTLTASPAWVDGFPMPDSTPPAAPTGLTATPYNASVGLSWTAPADTDLAGYNVYRSETSPVALTAPVNGGTLVTGTTYTDTGRTNGTKYYYVVTAVDTSTNQSSASNEANATPLASLGWGLNFDGTNDYVTFGTAAGLGVTDFTLETWFYWTGGGATTTTSGTQGLPSVIPLVSKGRGEADGDNRDMNYFLGIDTTTNTLAADFEDMASGMNHPVSAVTPITTNTWHHAAVTYDSVSGVWKIYLDGTLDRTLDIGDNVLPRSDSIQHAGLATAMTSTGTAAGFFQGRLDEVRIWNYARTLAEIRSTANLEVTSVTGLVARWGLNENTGTTIGSSVGTFPGTLTNGPTWTNGAPFNLVFDTVPPAAPTNLMSSPRPGAVLLEWTVNTEPDLAGYRVYRSTSSPVVKGTPINGTLTAPSFIDSTVTAGITYYYAVAAVDSSGNESDLSNETSAVPLPPPPAEALDLGSSNAYVSLGDNADTAQFTLETWLRRDGTGTAISSGTGGETIVPVITNGTADAETANADINYFFGIRGSDGVLCADFEEAQTGSAPGQNHPVCGVTPLVNGTWYHVAATYNGTVMRLYLNGNLDKEQTVGQPANAANISQLAFGTSMKTDNSTTGFFDGVLDEVRIWNFPRTQAEIAGTINAKITDPQTGLIGRWGMDEASGSVVNDSSGNAITGTINGTGYSWVAGSPFNATINLAPDAPVLVSPANGATGVQTTAPLSVTVTDPEGQPLNVAFFGRPKQAAAGPDFTIIAIPDPQYYASTYPSIYNAQMNWVKDNKTGNNIVFVASLGDNVDTASNTTQWTNADAAYDILDTAGVPYGVAAGNHDGAPSGTANFNTYFGTSRFAGKPWVHGNYGSDNDNHYALFEASGLEFIIIFIEYDDSMTSTEHPVLQWANGLLQTYSTRRGIVVSHNMLQGGTSTTFSTQGQTIYNALKANPNLFLMLGGHLDVAGNRTDVYNGSTVYTLRSDYQSVDSQQSGYLRIMRFSPADDMIYVRTYSPTQNKDYDKSDARANNFTLPYGMDGVGFTELGVVSNVASGGTATLDWTGLNPGEQYEWFVIASDGTHQTPGDTWNFTTATAGNHPPVITEGDSVNVSMSEDGAPTPFNLALNATDADAGDTLTWSVTGAASHGTASASGTGTSKTVGYAPAGNYSGADSFVVTVSDGNGGTDAVTVNVTITPVNDNPVLTNPGAKTNAEGDVVSLQIVASDVDLPAQTLTYSASNLPDGLTINTATGLISGTLSTTASTNSPYTVTLGVSDGNGGTASANFTWTVTDVVTPPADLSCTTIQPKPMTASTGEKPQSKVWKYNGSWYAVFPTSASGASSAGTWLWKLDGTSWTELLKLSSATNTKADVKVAGNLAHILLYNDPATELASVEFTGGTYQLWSLRPALTAINLPSSEIATIDIDSTGRLWLATRVDTPSPARIVVYYSDSPYTTFQGPVDIDSGVVAGDDISVVTAINGNQIGVLWSNQNTKRFGFRVHNDGDDPTVWSANELPASQSAIDNVGTGMADDHLNVKVASDGTLYAAVKTGYDTAGYPKMALLVRRPNGTWDDLYRLDESGTRGNIELDEARGVLTFIYTQSEGYNPIVYRQSNLSPISFGAKKTLRAESFNDVSSTKQNYNGDIVVIYASGSQVGGQICTGVPATGADLAVTKTDGVITVRPGDTLTYTVQVTNNGPEAVTGATVTDTLPSMLTTVSWTCAGSNAGTCTTSGLGNINDSVNLPVNASVTYTVSAKVDLGARGSIANTAAVTPPAGVTDPVTGNNSASDTDAIIADGTSCGSDPSLVGCWQMEEGSGSVLVDGSSFTNDASLVGAPVWAAGKVGTYALDLNGTTQYGIVPDDASLDLTNQVTLATWIKPEQYATQDLIKKATNGAIDGYELTLATTKSDDSSQRVFFRINQLTNGDTYRINAATMYPIDGTWMHVAATYDGTTMKLYVNGVLENSLTPPAGTVIAANSLPLTIGAQDGTTASRWFMGWMDDVRVYNRALSLAEIQALYGNTSPVAVNDAYDTNEDATLNTAAPGVLGNDTDAENNPLTAVKLSDPAHGALTLNSDGSFTYIPFADFNGTDSFTYKASDGSDSNPATVTIAVNAVNDSPIANSQSVTVDEDTSQAIVLVASDIENDPLTYTVGSPSHGTLTGTAPTLTYTPSLNYNGPDSFTFTVSDGVLDSNTATVSITVNAVNDVPVLDPIGDQTVNENALLAFNATASDPDTGDILTFSLTGEPAGAIISSAGAFTWTPTEMQGPGVYNFQICVSDGTVSECESISVTVKEVNTAPIADAQTLDLDEDQSIGIILTASDSDLPLNPLTFAVTNPAHGTLTGAAPNLTYTPAVNYNGTDSFTFKVDDGVTDSNTAVVTVNIHPVNDPPVANPQSVSLERDTFKNITLTGSDIEGSPLTFAIVTDPVHGTLTGVAPNVTYTPASGYVGADSFTFRVNDGSADSNLATVSIQVTDVGVPVLPSSFYGEVFIYDNPPSAGDIFEAYMPGVTGVAAFTALSSYQGRLVFSIDIPGGVKGAASEGDTITFKINGRVVSTAVWHSGTNVLLNIHPPQALPGGPYSGDEGALIHFNASSADWGGDASLYQWDWENDGTYDATGPSLDHTWNDNGVYTVGLKVTDLKGGVGTTTLTVTVNDVLPSNVDAGGPYTPLVGQAVTLNGSAICASVDTCTYAWDLDGDTQYDDATGPTPVHIWTSPGSYTISLRVTDDDGNAVTDTANVEITAAVHSIVLVPGWNLVSFNVHPLDTATEAVLSSVAGKYDLVYAWDATGAHSSSGNWLKADNIPFSMDTLTNLDETMGFWIHMQSAGTLEVVGSVPTSTNISLSTNAGGWNLVGYPSLSDQALPGVLSSHGVGTDFSLVYAYHANDLGDPWKLYDITNPLPILNDLQNMSPGWGYWVKVSADHAWEVVYQP